MAATQEEDIEIEDGECSDSGEEDGIAVDSTASSIPQQKSISEVTASSYRNRIPQIVINSDDSGNDDSDDDLPLNNKRTKQNEPITDRNSEWGGPAQTFVNPLLKAKATNGGFSSNGKTKKRNSIWGSVLTEQVLSHDIKGFGVNKSEDFVETRDVESYDFRVAQEDDRPILELDPEEVDTNKDDIFCDVVDLEDDVKRQERQKRKRKAKDRLGRRSYNKDKARDLKVTADSEKSEVVKAITDALNENNLDLFNRIVETVGNSVAIRLFHMTEEIERAGGMMTNDGYRRRSPGGTYIQLVKTDPIVTPEQNHEIFAADMQKWKEEQKRRRKIRRGRKRQYQYEKRKREKMDLDRPESPTPPEDLEVGEVLDGNDLPERPATPEPKDDSSDGEGGSSEEEEEVDISVAIARAKEALLKKQREMAAKPKEEASEMKEECQDSCIENEPVLDLQDESGIMDV